MNTFEPTWLIIKQHKTTGLKYFCKTSKKDPYKYNGSGKYWLRHLKKHGSDISTIWCQKFNDKQLLIDHAIKFSIENKIVESNEWANMCIENGIDGGIRPTSDKQKSAVSKALKGGIKTAAHKKKISINNGTKIKCSCVGCKLTFSACFIDHHYSGVLHNKRKTALESAVL